MAKPSTDRPWSAGFTAPWWTMMLYTPDHVKENLFLLWLLSYKGRNRGG
jgi:hypothetical protein